MTSVPDSVIEKPLVRHLSEPSQYHLDKVLPSNAYPDPSSLEWNSFTDLRDARIKIAYEYGAELPRYLIARMNPKLTYEKAVGVVIAADKEVKEFHASRCGKGEFTLFPKLPIELQDEIWRQFIRLRPRKVQVVCNRFGDGPFRLYPDMNHWILDGTGHKPVVLQINRALRMRAMKSLGYVTFKHPEITEIRPAAFNPEIDMLAISIHSFAKGTGPRAGHPLVRTQMPMTDLISCLKTCSAPTRLRSIALLFGERYFAANTDFDMLINHLASYEKLELVFLHFRGEVRWALRGQPDSEGEQEFARAEEPLGLLVNRQIGLKAIKQSIEEKLSQSGKPIPHVELVTFILDTTARCRLYNLKPTLRMIEEIRAGNRRT